MTKGAVIQKRLGTSALNFHRILKLIFSIHKIIKKNIFTLFGLVTFKIKIYQFFYIHDKLKLCNKYNNNNTFLCNRFLNVIINYYFKN